MLSTKNIVETRRFSCPQTLFLINENRHPSNKEKFLLMTFPTTYSCDSSGPSTLPIYRRKTVTTHVTLSKWFSCSLHFGYRGNSVILGLSIFLLLDICNWLAMVMPWSWALALWREYIMLSNKTILELGNACNTPRSIAKASSASPGVLPWRRHNRPCCLVVWQNLQVTRVRETCSAGKAKGSERKV